MKLLGKLNSKFLLGLIFGATLSLGVFFLYTHFLLSDCTIPLNNKVGILKASKSDTLMVNMASQFNDLAIQEKNFDSRLISINKRIDDFYICFGIIITLLLGINVGIFVNAEVQVEKYFRDNFQHYLDRTKKVAEDAEKHMTKLQTQNELTNKLATPIQQDPEPLPEAE